MRHEQIAASDSYDRIDIAAVWPVTAQIAPLPIPDIDRAGERPASMAAPAAPDLPVAVAKLIVASYAALIGAFAVAAAGSRESIYMISIAALFVVMFFAVPRLLLGLKPKQERRPSLGRFLQEGMETLNGHNSGKAALVQMLIVPVFLTLAALAMAVSAALIF